MARPDARPGLSGLCLSAAWPTTRRPAPSSRRWPRLPATSASPGSMRWPPAMRAMRWSAAIGRAPPSCRSSRASSPMSMRSRTSRVRWGRRAPANRRPPRPTSPSSPSCATSCAMPRTPTGRRWWTSSARSRPPGCCNAEGKHAEALKAMSAAADAEDKTEKHPVTPGPLAPARELYGAMLLERGMAKEALAAFEATMAKEPNRYNGLAGAAQAAEMLGDKAKAKAQYEQAGRSRRRQRCRSARAGGGAAVPGEELEIARDRLAFECTRRRPARARRGRGARGSWRRWASSRSTGRCGTEQRSASDAAPGDGRPAWAEVSGPCRPICGASARRSGVTSRLRRRDCALSAGQDRVLQLRDRRRRR